MGKSEKKQEQCIHYWVIDSPNGRTSSGRCKFCGIEKIFSNYWYDLSPQNKSAADNDKTSFAEAISVEEQ